MSWWSDLFSFDSEDDFTRLTIKEFHGKLYVGCPMCRTWMPLQTVTAPHGCGETTWTVKP